MSFLPTSMPRTRARPRAFADRAAPALENARLYEGMRSSARRFEALSRADNELFRSLDLDTVLQAFVDVTVDVLGVDKSIVTTGTWMRA